MSDDLPDSAEARPSFAATLAGCVTIATGLTALVTSAQLYTIFYISGWMLMMWLCLVAATVGQMILGGLTLSGSDWATIAATVLTWGLGLAALVIIVYCISHGLIAPLIMLWGLANLLAALVLPLSIPAALRTSAARRQLYAI